ncbi:uncharacterized protein [Rutidosis leptorrhynchoides]|uniref:uncharacterized protein n=1 Tax=Rutidosis leptorrhynchoides TaxID=125765 RepID=UPI003A99A81C
MPLLSNYHHPPTSGSDSSIVMYFSTSNGEENEPSSSSSVQGSQPCRRFEFDEIQIATENFNESLVIGHGGFGKVYKGKVFNGPNLVEAAIKRLDSMSSQGAAEFWAEIETLSMLRHCNLVSLFGYCKYEKEMILVYEYMPNGTLEDHLHKLGTPLSWLQRLKICIGAGRGLHYLHTGTGIEFGVIHRDVKSSNILLHKSWAAKIADFGLSKIGPINQQSSYVQTVVKGTFGYLDPDYYATGKLTRKSDVYAFGVVLLEVLCRKRAVDSSLDKDQWNLARWCINEGQLKHVIDSEIRGHISPKCLKEFVGVAERCLHSDPKQRPTMAKALVSLESALILQEKFNGSLEGAGKTIFGRIADMFPFSSSAENSGVGFGSSVIYYTAKNRRQRQKLFEQSGGKLLEDKLKANSGLGVGSMKIFRAEELEEATDIYSEKNILAKGVNGVVYKGILRDKRRVVIKNSQKLDEGQWKQVVILAQINHQNVVQLLGCCLETDPPLLAYEFISNDTLYHHIHDKTNGMDRLSWNIRLRIAHESAGALAYLHTDARMSIIHRDVRSTNILLDDNYTAKIADFGASRLVPLGHDQVTTLVQGTLGYLDPEYFHTGQLTDKSDVYSFGVVLAELLTGEKPLGIERSLEDRNLATYFVKAKRENRLFDIVDREVAKDASKEQIVAACDLVCRCINLVGVSRPSMKEVTMELETIRKLGENLGVSQDSYKSNLMIESESMDLFHVPLLPNSDTFGSSIGTTAIKEMMLEEQYPREPPQSKK